MDLQRQIPHKFFAELPISRVTASFILVTAGVASAGILCANAHYREAAVVAAVALGAGLLSFAPISVEAVLIAWFTTTPLASFYIRFPTDRSIITYNRGVFALVVVMLLLRLRREATSRRTGGEAPTRPDIAASSLVKPERQRASFPMSRFEVAWALLSVLALASAVAQSNNFTYAARIALDAFWLPLVAFHIARNHFDLSRRGGLFLLGGISLALFLFATGAFEFATGSDLLRYKGSEIVREGERRVNGPFAADSSYAIICLMLFLFLAAAPRLFRARFDRTGKLVYALALAGAALGSLLPLFRVVALAFVVCWIVLQWPTGREQNGGRRLSLSAALRNTRIGSLIVVILIVVVGGAAAIAPSVLGSRLADPRTAFGRLATWEAAAEIALENPVFGVGLGNYAEAFDRAHYYADEPVEEVLDTEAANSPHSNVLWIGAEFGVAGLGLYIAANIYLFLIGWRALKRAEDQRWRTAALCFLALVGAYWIPGLTLASGYYSDLNLYFFFLLGAISTQFHRRK